MNNIMVIIMFVMRFTKENLIVKVSNYDNDNDDVDLSLPKCCPTTIITRENRANIIHNFSLI